MKKLLAMIIICCSPYAYANGPQLYQPNTTYANGHPKYHTIRNILGGVETVGHASYDHLQQRGVGSITTQWYPGYHRETVLYPPDSRGKIYKYQILSQNRNSETNFSPIITIEFSGYIN